MPTMMARIQVKYGRAEQFHEIMKHLVPVLERHGWKLLGAYQTQIGRLWEYWDIWKVADASQIRSVLDFALQDTEFQEWAGQLPECVEEEELRYLDQAPYGP
jgi:NIPSNAP